MDNKPMLEEGWGILTNDPTNPQAVRVLTDNQGQIFDLTKPDDVSELVLLHNSQLAQVMMQRDTAEEKLQVIEDAMRQVEEEEEQDRLNGDEGEDGLEYETTWVDVAYRLVDQAGGYIGLGLFGLLMCYGASLLAHETAGTKTAVVQTR